MFTYQFKLKPNKETQNLLWKHGNKLNFLYNYFLNQRIENYKSHKENPSVKLISKNEQIKELVSLKSQDPELKKIYSQNLQAVPKRLQNSYDSFFERIKKGDTPGFPKFRSCKKFFGFLYPQSGYKIKDNYFITKTYGKIEFEKYRDIQGNIKQVYISNKNNTFYINILSDNSYAKNTTTNSTLAIDIGLTNLVVGIDNKGNRIVIKNKNHGKYFTKQISKIQSKRDLLPKIEKEGKKVHSRKYKKLNRLIQKLYEVKNRKINDFQHKVSKRLSSQYDTIIVENLSVKKMSESDNSNLNRNIRDSKLSQFITFLNYKTDKLLKVKPYNTSKTCNHCGFIHKDLKLSDRKVKCLCGKEYDRDENAAINIYCLGQAILLGYAVDIDINQLLSTGSPYLGKFSFSR